MVMRTKVDPQKKLSNALTKAGVQVQDLTIPLKLISQQWFKSNRAIFTLKSNGKYVDLSDIYKPRKQAKWGFKYPILKASGKLEDSITNPANRNAIDYIINRKNLVLGTNLTTEKGAPYPYFHHHGLGNLPERPVVLFGNEQVAPNALSGRIRQWEQMILDHVAQVSGAK